MPTVVAAAALRRQAGAVLMHSTMRKRPASPRAEAGRRRRCPRPPIRTAVPASRAAPIGRGPAPHKSPTRKRAVKKKKAAEA